MSRMKRSGVKRVALLANSFCILGALLIAIKCPMSGLAVSFFGNAFMFGYGHYTKIYSFCVRAVILMVIYGLGVLNWYMGV